MVDSLSQSDWRISAWFINPRSEIFGFAGSDDEVGVEDLLNGGITTPNFGPSLEKDMMNELNKVMLKC